jgi:excisionase family DNA binding protein
MTDVTSPLATLDEIADELAQRGDTQLAERTRSAVAALRSASAPPDLVSTGEAAKLLGIRSINTVKRWAREGLLDGFRIGGRVKVTRASVERMRESSVLAREQAYERKLAKVLDAFDAGDEPLPPSKLLHGGRAPWDSVAPERK